MPDLNDELLETDVSEGVRLLSINRPLKRNALSTDLLARLASRLTAAQGDPMIRVVVLTGSDRLFAAGADIDELETLDASDPISSRRFLAWQAIRAFSKPAIAAVEGWCLGAGLELALSCDIIVSGESARFGQPETNLALIPGGGGTAILPRVVGKQLAMRMILTGRPIDAATAQTAGLVGEIVPDGTTRTVATDLAATIARRAPLAVMAAKASLRDALELPLADHLVSERRRFVALLGTADKCEGINAFKAKRPARWTGR